MNKLFSFRCVTVEFRLLQYWSLSDLLCSFVFFVFFFNYTYFVDMQIVSLSTLSLYYIIFSKWFWNCRKMSSNAFVVVVFVIVAFVLVDIQQWALHFQIVFHAAHRRYNRIMHKINMAHSKVKCNKVFSNGTNDIAVQLTLF